MYSCPACNENTIGVWRKFNSTSLSPAKCPSCGALSFVSAWANVFSSLVFEALLWVSLLTALFSQSWLPLLIFPAGIFLWGYAIALMFPMRVTNHDAVRASRRRFTIAIAASVTLVLILFYALGR